MYVGHNMTEIMGSFLGRMEGISMVVFIVGFSGTFKHIILDAGVGDDAAKYKRFSLNL